MRSVAPPDSVEPESVVTIGTFDGIHLGHRALLQCARLRALTSRQISIAYTFEKPPQNYLGTAKKLLLPPKKKLELLHDFIDQVEVVDFPGIRPLTPEEFASEILVQRLHAKAVVIGGDFLFGVNRQGNSLVLKSLGERMGFDVVVVDPVKMDGEVVSSTAIRNALSAGDVERATRFLGEAPRLWGTVIRGEGQAALLGFPTANLALDPEVLIPSHGIYVVQVSFDGKSRLGALYVGNRPTFGGQSTSVEVHLLDEINLDLFGREIELKLFHRVRQDIFFERVERLQAQIRADIEAIRIYFSNKQT